MSSFGLVLRDDPLRLDVAAMLRERPLKIQPHPDASQQPHGVGELTDRILKDANSALDSWSTKILNAPVNFWHSIVNIAAARVFSAVMQDCAYQLVTPTSANFGGEIYDQGAESLYQASVMSHVRGIANSFNVAVPEQAKELVSALVSTIFNPNLDGTRAGGPAQNIPGLVEFAVHSRRVQGVLSGLAELKTNPVRFIAGRIRGKCLELGAPVVINRVNFSSKHLALARDGDNVCIEDLGSTNGTLVNGSEIKGYGVRPLETGSLVQVGSFDTGWPDMAVFAVRVPKIVSVDEAKQHFSLNKRKVEDEFATKLANIVAGEALCHTLLPLVIDSREHPLMTSSSLDIRYDGSGCWSVGNESDRRVLNRGTILTIPTILGDYEVTLP